MAKKNQIDQFIHSMMNSTQGSNLESLADNDTTTQEEAITKSTAPKFEPSFEQKYEVERLRSAHRGKKALQDPAEKTRKTVGIEMTADEIFRIEKAVYELRMTKRDLIRTAIQEYLESHNL